MATMDEPSDERCLQSESNTSAAADEFNLESTTGKHIDGTIETKIENAAAAEILSPLNDASEEVNDESMLHSTEDNLSEYLDVVKDEETESREKELNQLGVVHAAAVNDEDEDDDDDLFGDGDNDDEGDTNNNESTEPEIEPVPGAATADTDTFVHSTTIADGSIMADPSVGSVLTIDTTGEDVNVEPPSNSVVSKVIPRKSSANGATATNSPETKNRNITYTKAVLTSLGLPEGILVPYSVDKEKLLNNNPNNRKMMDTLRSLPVKLVNDALSEYDDAVQVKGNSIRNLGAYLYGVVKRYVAVQERSISGGDGTGILPMGETLTVTVQTRLEQLVSSGFCTRDEMNDKVKSKIKMLPEKDALFALDELSSVSRSQIRNFGSYFMGILNRYMRGDDEKNKNNPGQGGGQNQYHTSSPHKPGVILPSYPSQNSNTNPHFQQRGRDRNSTHYTHQQQGQYHDRDRSRDRFNSNSNDNRRFSQNQNGRDRSFNQGAGNKSSYDNRVQSQQQMPTWQQNAQQQQQVGMMSYTNPSSTNIPNQSYPAIPQQYPMYPHQNPTQPNSTNQYQPQSQQTLSLNPSSQFAPQQSYSNPQQQQSAQYGQQPPSLVSSTPYGPPSAPPGQQHYMQPQYPLNPSSQQQAQNALYSRPNNHQQSTNNMMMHQPQRAGGGWQQQPAMLPVDIMGLADKAASAVQALQNRPSSSSVVAQSYAGQQPQQQIYAAQTYPQQPQHAVYGGVGTTQVPPNQYPNVIQGSQILQPQYSSASQLPTPSSYLNSSQVSHANQDSNRNRRTSASLGQLPHGVQYMIQNLMATQSIEGPLDDGILGMIHDLPEDLAMTSLQKFALLDKSSMRNKTAYLAGVLRRELEKIRRR